MNFRSLKSAASMAAFCGTAAGFANDFLVPLADSADLLIVPAGLLALIAIFSSMPPIYRFLTTSPLTAQWPGLREIAGPPSLVFCVILGIFVLGASLLTQKNLDEGGFLSAQSVLVKEAQGSLLGIEKKIEAVGGKLDDISNKLDGVKKETSADPRKELANMGVSWSDEAFREALENGDETVITLFIAGGKRVSQKDAFTLSLLQYGPGIEAVYDLHGINEQENLCPTFLTMGHDWSLKMFRMGQTKSGMVFSFEKLPKRGQAFMRRVCSDFGRENFDRVASELLKNDKHISISLSEYTALMW